MPVTETKHSVKARVREFGVPPIHDALILGHYPEIMEYWHTPQAERPFMMKLKRFGILCGYHQFLNQKESR